jgi:hypothetical protein
MADFIIRADERVCELMVLLDHLGCSSLGL